MALRAESDADRKQLATASENGQDHRGKKPVPHVRPSTVWADWERRREYTETPHLLIKKT